MIDVLMLNRIRPGLHFLLIISAFAYEVYALFMFTLQWCYHELFKSWFLLLFHV